MKIIFLVWLWVTCLFCFAGCSSDVTWFCKKNVELVLPDFAGEFEENAAPVFVEWHIVVCSKNGTREFREKEGCCFELNRNEIGAVLAYPVCLSGVGEAVEFFRPAGALFTEAENGKLILDWYGGVRAWLVKELFEKELKTGVNADTCEEGIGRFNWKKLTQTQEKMFLDEDWDYINNPWKMNLEAALKAIAAGSFRANLLSVSRVFQVEAPENGACYSEFVPENKNIKKKGKILIKQSEVNLISDYNLTAIIIVGTSADNYTVKHCSLPATMKSYE